MLSSVNPGTELISITAGFSPFTRMMSTRTIHLHFKIAVAFMTVSCMRAFDADEISAGPRLGGPP